MTENNVPSNTDLELVNSKKNTVEHQTTLYPWVGLEEQAKSVKYCERNP